MSAVRRFPRVLLLLVALLPAATLQAATATDPQAENMLLLQTASGGWSKHYRDKAVDYRRPLDAAERAALRVPGRTDDATIDNKALADAIGAELWDEISTEQVTVKRVIDEEKLAAVVADHPELLEAIRGAVVPGEWKTPRLMVRNIPPTKE